MVKKSNTKWNPWYGCEKVSIGCNNCYAEKQMTRFGMNFNACTISRSKFLEPYKWNNKNIFVCSWSDFFLKKADKFRENAWKVIRDNKQNNFLILTKRPERIKQCLPDDWKDGYSNVWLGVTIEHHSQINRLTHLYNTPAKVKFISAEPLLSDLNFQTKPNIDWIILGGESGHNARHCNYKWLINIYNQFYEFKIPIFIKQLGSANAKLYKLKNNKGAIPHEWPEQFPKTRNIPQ